MGTGLTAVKQKEILSDVHDDANNLFILIMIGKYVI